MPQYQTAPSRIPELLGYFQTCRVKCRLHDWRGALAELKHALFFIW